MGRSLTSHFVRFALFGLAGTAAHFALLALLVEAFGARPVSASVAGAVLGAAVNYMLNWRFNYHGRRDHGHAAPRFGVVALSGLGLNALLMALLLAPLLSLHYLHAQVLTTALVLLWNFAANHFWTFGVRLK